MRILLATLFYPPHRNAGTENYTQGLARELSARGHHVEVACAGTWEAGPRYWNGVTRDTRDGIPIHSANLHWRLAPNPNRVLYDSPVVADWFTQLLRDVRPDVLHVTSAITLGVGMLKAARILAVPRVLTLMDYWFMCPRTVLVRGDGQLCDGRTTTWDCQKCLLAGSKLVGHLNRWVPRPLERAVWGNLASAPIVARARGFRGMALDMPDRRAALRTAFDEADVVLAHSRFVAATFEAAGWPARIRHLPNGHNLRRLDAFRAKRPSPVVRFVYVGQITPMKGVHLLVEAFRGAGLSAAARLDVWGPLDQEPEYAARLRTAADGDGSIAFHGRFNHERIGEVLQDADVLVVPSVWYENAPLVIHEAFATKTPVIATNLGGMAEAVSDEVNGLLFARGDAQDLGRQMRRLVDEPGLWDRLADGTPPVRTLEDEIVELEDVYQEAASRAAMPR